MFSKLMKKIIAVAAFAAMTSVMAAVATPWWTIDFDSYTDGDKVSASTETQGAWTQQDDDLSVVTSTENGNVLSLNTQGKDLLWTPNAPAESYDSVILDADVTFVASDVEPTTDNSMQTAIYLKATDDGDVLCAYQATKDGPAWQALEGFTIANGDTKKVTITIDYSDESGTPMVTLTIDGTSVEYPVANVADKVSSVAFCGTGVVDNFTAQTSVNATYVAEVDGQGFNTYAAALAHLAANGGTLKITGDSDETLSFGELTFNSDATIDLNGKTIEASFVVDNRAQLKIDNGTVNAPMGYDVVYIKNGKATVGAGAVLNASDNCAVFMKNLENANAQLALDVYGKLYVTNDTGYAAIYGNGNNVAESTINIFDDAVVSHDFDLAIYHPQPGTLTIGAATITGTTAIEMRAGELVVNEGAFIEGTAEFSATPNGNGSTVLGAAIALSQHTTEQPTSVTVNGGTLKGARAFYQDNLASGTSTSVSATIAAGTTLDGVIEVAEEGFEMPQAADGSYTLEAVTYVANVGTEKFKTYAEAFDYVVANGGDLVITGASDETLGVYNITKDATIDLGGQSITAAFEVNNGAQFTIDNGTVTAPMGSDVIAIYNGTAEVGADAILYASDNCVVYLNDETPTSALNLVVSGDLYVTNDTGYAAIQGNGNNVAESNIEIKDGATVKHNFDLAIYHAQVGTLTIDAATITGTTGIEMRAGNLVVNEGAIIEGTAEFSATPNGNGSTVLGAAIALSQHTTEQPTSVTVNGGTLKGARAFYQDNLASGTSTSVSATIAAGTTLDGAIEVAEEGFVMPKSEVDGSYTLATADFVVAGMPYDTFADAYDAATDGETIEVYTDFAASEIITIAKSITIDGNDHTLTSTATRAINVSGADGVTIQNLTIVTTGERGINVIQGATNVTIKNVNVTAANYAVNLAASAAGAKVTVVDSTLNGLNVVNVGAANAVVTVDGSTLNCNDDRENDDFAALALNKDATGAQIIATNSTFDVKGDSCVASNGAENGYISINGSTDAVKVEVAYIVSANDYYNAYTSLAEAIAAAKAGDTVKLLRDVTATEAITIAKDVTIDLNGKTITSAFFVKEGADVTIDNGTLVAANGEDAVTVENGKLTIAKDAIVKATTYGAVRLKNLEDPSAKLELVVDGKIYGTNEGTALVYNNGSNVAKSNITINDDAIINHEADLAIYHPGAGTLTIGAATITGTTGIEMRAGDLVVNGATITAKEGTEFAMTPNGNGSTTVGAAVALSQHSTSLPTSVTVNSGTLAGDVAFYAAGDAEDISATIGKDVDLADGADIVVAEGFEMPKNENGSYTLEAVTYVANVGTEKFKTYAEAFDYVVANGGDLVITGASNETLGVYNITKDATIDLGDQSITAAFVVDGGAQFEIDNGTVTALAKNDVIFIKDGKATVGADATLNASTDCAVFMKNLDNADAQLALDVYGTLVGAAGFGTIQGNGSNKPASVINIYDGATVTNDADLAIYHPQNGTLTIGAATITGTTGIEMRAGNLVVNGATITATGTYSAEANGNGSTTVGAAVALSQHDTSLPTTVTVNSGTLTGDVAFYAAGDAEDISATIAKDVVLADGADIVVAEGFEMPKADDGSYTLGVAKVEFAPVKTTSIVIDGNTAKLTIDGECTEVKVYFKETLDAEWTEVEADFAEGVITVPATTATGFFTVHAR